MWNSSQMPLPPSMSRASRAIASAFPHEFRFSIDTTSGAALQGQGQGQGCCHPLRQPPPQRGGTHLPSSLRRPRRRQACSPSAISVTMSASFFCTSWLRASGPPNCFLRCRVWRWGCCGGHLAGPPPRPGAPWARRYLSRTYCRAISRQASAAPRAPQAMPYRAWLRQPKGPWGEQASLGTTWRDVPAPPASPCRRLPTAPRRGAAGSPQAPPRPPARSCRWWRRGARTCPRCGVC